MSPVDAGQGSPVGPGSDLGPYRIEAEVGAGGMGVVFRARDTRLARVVAIKILPPSLAADPERRRRFESEARAVAALEHPHICVLHDIGSVNGVDFLVLEHLEGQTLAQRLKKGRLRLKESLGHGVQIAEALGAAHRHGIVHRDLKPANVMLTPSGAKLLDFGLAKLRARGGVDGIGANTEVTADETKTESGVLLGTLPYLSPEQVEGHDADARSDIWALGVVLYEMLTGRRAFPGTNAAGVVAAILEHEPPSLRSVDTLIPPSLSRLVGRCLARDPEARWQSARDVADELKWIAEGGGAEAPRGVGQRPVWPWVTATTLLAFLALGLLIDSRGLHRGATAATRAQLSVAPAEALEGRRPLGQWIGGIRTSLALSPDGRRLAFVGRVDRSRRLYVRALDKDLAVALAGTDDAENPFFSPDGEWIGFWARGRLWKVRVIGGPPVVLCALPPPLLFGASWGPNQRIVFAVETGGLREVDEQGGEPRVLTTLRPGELSHRLPQVLPGGEGVLFTVLRRFGIWSEAQVAVQSLQTGDRRILVEGGSDARYVSSGHIVFLRLGSLMAVPFDPSRLDTSGGVVGFEEGIAQAARLDNTEWDSGAGQFAVSLTGTLVFVPGGPRSWPDLVLARVDRHGSVTHIPTTPRAFYHVRVAPDRRRVAAVAQDDHGYQLFMVDVETGIATGLDAGTGVVWSPDGREVVYRRWGEGLMRRAVDGPGPAELVLEEERACWPASWSAKGGGLACVRSGPEGHLDIQFLEWIGRQASARPLHVASHSEWSPELSPDGRWMAFVSDESGRAEVYVQTFPDGASRRQVSTNGGVSPAWAPDGRELFYTVGSRRPDAPGLELMTSLRILEDAPLRLGPSSLLFEFDNDVLGFHCRPTRCYDVAPDGQGFYVGARTEPTKAAPEVTRVNLILDWAAELKARAPTGR